MISVVAFSSIMQKATKMNKNQKGLNSELKFCCNT